jgi:hypothetical protein
MGKKSLGILLFACCLSSAALAQRDTVRGYPYPGLLRGSLTYSIGTMPSISVTNAYLTGNLEYYPDDKMSVRGDLYYFFNSLNNSKIIKQNHQLYFGALYNFPLHSNFNPFIGIQPGVAYIQLYPVYGSDDPVTFSPLASAIVGFNFFGEKWFHLSVNIRYAVGKHLDQLTLFNINELSFAFGLGLDLDVLGKTHTHTRAAD